MGKLIKAELYRTKKVNGFWVFTFFIALYMTAAPFVSAPNVESAETFFVSSMSMLSVGAMLISLMAAYIAGRGYHHRTCMYEVMAGNGSMRIILSKLLSIALPIALIVYAAHLVGLGIACTMSTQGISEVLKQEPLFLLSLLRYTLFGVLLTMCVKSMLGPVLVYVRLLLETIGLLIASAVTSQDLMDETFNAASSDSFLSTILNVTCLSKQGVILTSPMSPDVVWQSLGGFAIELLLWGGIAYLVYSRKDY